MYKFSKIIFAYYLLFLFWGILFKFDITHTINTAHLFPSRSLNVSPFDASGGRLEILFNILIFIPFGFLWVAFQNGAFLENGEQFSLSVSLSKSFNIFSASEPPI